MSDDFDYRVKRQRRKTMALHVLPDATVEVRAPRWVAVGDIAAFVEQRADWVVSQREKALQRQRLKPAFVDGAEHYYLGRPYRLSVYPAARATVDFSTHGWTIGIPDPVNKLQVEKVLYQWFRRQAQPLFEQRLAYWLQRMPLVTAQPALKLRKMRRRWGSCSSKRVVTLNLLLVQLSQDCIDYVICHELCHLHHLNHSQAFYDLLSVVMPDWQQREQQIEHLSASL